MTPAWVGESSRRSGGQASQADPARLIVAVFRHYESRAAESRPLLHDHAVLSIRLRRPDGKRAWDDLSADSLGPHRRGRQPLRAVLHGGDVRPARVGPGAARPGGAPLPRNHRQTIASRLGCTFPRR
ncbi:relaxase domain-containing protein [Streptomyces sp. NPDC059818]|uniref:relaxase domain-containing protein n=1 Tax=Streptomyces sp. NPDC059818 TaxID=3346962 RepID=UPI00365562E2